METKYQESCSFENPTHLSRKTKKLIICSAKFKHYIEHSADSKLDNCATFIYVFRKKIRFFISKLKATHLIRFHIEIPIIYAKKYIKNTWSSANHSPFRKFNIQTHPTIPQNSISIEVLCKTYDII